MNLKNKKGATGEAILMVYRIILVSFIALIVLGTAAIFYNYEIDVRNVEARILAKKVLGCLAPLGELDLDKIDEKDSKNILDYCGIKNTGRFYVSATVYHLERREILKKLEHGDSGIVWVKDILDESGQPITEILPVPIEVELGIMQRKDLGEFNYPTDFKELELYRPGYISGIYPLFVLDSGKKTNAKLYMEVVVAYGT